MEEKNKGDLAGERARELFLSGFNCAESVLMAVTESLGVADDLVPRIATGFGGGISGHGYTCGAVTGAVMAAGVVLGRDAPGGDPERLYGICSTMMDEFDERFSSVVCFDLVGVDWRDAGEKARALKDGVLQEKCAAFVEFAASRTVEFLAMSQES
jgi:C_GCAxxG_C_C family probable redox protein